MSSKIQNAQLIIYVAGSCIQILEIVVGVQRKTKNLSDTASVQWPVPLDALDTRHVSSLGHVSRIQRVQWHWPLDRSRVRKRKQA